MERTNGVFIVIESAIVSDAIKQLDQLFEHLQNENHDVVRYIFPQYDQPSSYFLREYLSGKYGSAEEVGPYTGSIFYALDRYEAAPKIKQALSEGKIVLANGFTPSSMAHHGTKFSTAEERRGYFIWLDNLDYKLLRIPRPDKNIVLRVTAEASDKFNDTPDHKDINQEFQDNDPLQISKTIEVYDDLCQLFPKDFTRIDYIRGNKLLTNDQVSDMVLETVRPHLPQPANKPSSVSVAANLSNSVKLDNPFVIRAETGWQITDAGRQYLKEAVTDVDGNVYAIKDKLDAVTAAAAMARLSRRGDDLRVTILDEFALRNGRDSDLLERVITTYGDESVQQLAGIHLVVENASNLLTKHLERGRLAAYLEQSTRYIYYDQKDSQGRYRYYTPTTLDDLTKIKYARIMDSIFDTYSMMAKKLTDYIQKSSSIPEKKRDRAWQLAIKAQACDAIRPVLPVATTSTVGIFANGQAIEALIMRLRASDNHEAIEAGNELLVQARKVIPILLERADKPERGGAITAYMSATNQNMTELAQKYLPNNHSDVSEPVRLVHFWPRNELDLLPQMLYKSSSLSLHEIEKEIDTWPVDRKLEVFQEYMGERLNRRHRPGRALENAHYTWDILCSYGIFRDLQRHRIVDALEWQILTPRYGYEIPDLIEKAELDELYEKCFDLSTELYSVLQNSGYSDEAQYATLMGHRMRWKVTYNAREAFHIHELRTTPQSHPGCRKLMNQMHEKLAEVHPMLAEAMKFVNQNEDPELTRLAAERYTQFKLRQLDEKSAKTK